MSPQLLSAQRGITESPSPIPTPDAATSFRSHAESQCTLSVCISNATEEEDARNASKAITQRMAWHGTDKCSIVKCVVAEGIRAERSAAECQTDADCMAEVDSECQGMLRCQPAECNGTHLTLTSASHITSCAVVCCWHPFSMSQIYSRMLSGFCILQQLPTTDTRQKD